MNYTSFAAVTLAAATALAAGSAQAFEVTGGSVGLSYSAFADDTDFNRLGLEGSVELGFGRNFGLQLDVGYSDFDISGIDSQTFGLHGIYHLNEATSLGAFYTREDVEGSNLDILGIEAGHEVMGWTFEGYIADIDGAGAGGSLGGVAARYALAEGLGVTGSYDRAESEGDDVSRLALRLDRNVSPNANLFVEVGTARFDLSGVSDSEPFVGLGGKISFGAARGTTFDQRGFARLIPGL